MQKDPLHLRLHFQPHMHELVRYISYGGKREKEVLEKCLEMQGRFGQEKVMQALGELTMREEKSGLTVLRPEVRSMCRQILGPAPEAADYEHYWSINRRTPPADHQPPAPEEPAKPAKRGRKR